MSVISFEELSAYMGGSANITPGQKDLIRSVVIPGVQEELEKYLNTPVELVQVRESLQPETNGCIYFTVAPVKKLLSAIWSSAGAVPQTITQYQPDPVLMDPSITRPVINRTGAAGSAAAYRYDTGYSGLPGIWAGTAAPYMVVDYIAGYDGTNDSSLKMALLRVTSREVERQFDTSVGIRNGSLENVAPSDERPKGWTREELRSFDRLKRRVVL